MPRSDVFGVLGSIEFKLDPKRTALVIIDMQYLDAHRDYGMGADAKKMGITAKYDYYFNQLDNVVIPNTQKLLATCRATGIQVIYPRIASLVSDCRDVSLEHKRAKLMAAAKSREAQKFLMRSSRLRTRS